LRYPGGKQRLAPFIIELLTKNGGIGGHYAEPYAGGCGIAIELLLDNHVEHIHLNDSSVPIYAFWKSVISKPEELCRLISNASLTVEEWKKRRAIVQQPEGHDELQIGFSTFFLNRCNRSGVLSGGLIGGLQQTGTWKMDARFPRNELVRRVEAIACKKDSITLKNWDAEKFIIEYIPTLPANTFVYCDPPYFEKSSRLYLDRYEKEDHKRIAKIIQKKLPRKWAVSYDNADQVLGYYSERRWFSYDLQYNAARYCKGKEVFILSDDVLLPQKSAIASIDEAIRGRGQGRPLHSMAQAP
jgi:DNA adenine methylase